jgi:hypothetical protein
MAIILWVIGFLAVGLLAGNAHGPITMFPVMGISPLLAAAIPSIIGIFGSLLKGKKTKFANQQTPQQQEAYNQLLQMLMQRNKTGSNSMNQVRNMFYGQQGQQTTQPPIAQATRPRPQVY